jgi:pilus assembly protein Flp/PilA
MAAARVAARVIGSGCARAQSDSARCTEMGRQMKSLLNIARRLARDEQGGEVLEYALIAGLIVVAAIAVIASVGTKVLGRWTSVDSSI